MTFLKRLRVLPAVLGAAAALVAVGSSLFGNARPGPAGDPVRPDGGRVIEELAVSKFSKLPVLTYQAREGDVLFAWQVRPAIDPTPPRPHDIVVVVDTSASQAGKPLQQARQIITALAAALTPDDRVSVWSASTPAATRSLTRGFFAPGADEVRAAAAALTETEYGSGATDLKYAINQAVATLAPARGRQQLVLFLGDGESSFNPVTEDDRIDLGTKVMDARDVAFFAVPLGIKVNPQNLHGLATLTGGAVVRVQENLADPLHRNEFVARLKAALDVPVLKVEKFKFGDEVGESFPTRLPPLRADRPTLVMGKLANNVAGAVTLSLSGTVVNRPTTLNLSQALPDPRPDHFFLNLMIDQWRGAPHKDAPAMLQSDRALALASTQVQLYRDEFLVQAVWAIRMDQWDDAAKLYQAAQKLDPHDKEAAAGLALLERLKAGKVTRNDIQQKISVKVDALKIASGQVGRTVVQDTFQDPPAAGAAGAPPAGAPPQAAADAIAAAAARRAIEEQRYRVLVDATIRRARQLLRVDPDAAYQDLKRQRDEVLGYDVLGGPARAQLVADIESVMREVFLKGTEVKRQAAAERERIAMARQRLNEFDRAQDAEAATKNRIDQFRQLMQHARFELAYQEAQLMIAERVSRGQTVPPSTVASYIIGQQATHLREWRELVRIRQDRFLLTMLQTEKSAIPYPDEPPVHFPPAAVWRELTSLRREAYLNSNLGVNPPQSLLDLRHKVEDWEVPPIENLNDIPLLELLTKLSTQASDTPGFPGPLTFIIMDEAFKAEGAMGDIKEKKPNLPATRLRGMKLGAFLDIVLMSMNATFIVRPDYIEITTFGRRLEEKVTRVFPVADLVIPIPSSVNQQQLFQNLSIQNQQLAIFGQVVGAANFQGFGGAFGGGQQGGGGFNQPGGGAFGNNPLAQFGGGQGGGGGPGGANRGFGGGFAGVGGGQLGQFGNLGGQFGLQGGDQSLLLLSLIRDTVAKGEWALPSGEPPPAPGGVEDTVQLQASQLNSLGYYPPARALIIRGTSRYHPATTIKLKPREGMAAGNGRDNGAVVIGPGTGRPGGPGANPGNNPRPKDPVVAAPPQDPKAPIAADPGAGKPTITDPKVDAVALKKRLSPDSKQKWSQAIDWTVTDPGLIVASAEFLMEMDEYQHAAEVLKGSLRKGLTTDAWAHESLALALQMSQASPAEVERAAVSAIDLDPTDAKGYLKAAKFEAEVKNPAQALAFCKRAAEFAPDQPAAYANALAFASQAADARDVKTDAVMWAANNLLRRDWSTADGIDYHAETELRLQQLETKLAAAGQKTDDLRKALTERTQRDLVIEVRWQGSADLDLVVAEPGGSVCSATHKRTTAGGVLQGDQLGQTDDRSEQYTAAVAFSGTYKVSVKQAFGKPIGGTVQVHVWKMKGTPKESYDLITLDLNSPKPVEVALKGGSRTELATVTEDDDGFRARTTGATLTTGVSGIGGGFGTAGSLIGSPVTTNSGPNLPVVSATTETRLPGISSSAADLRASVKVNADRQTMTYHVNPVFGTGKAVTMPKVPLLPGSEEK